MSGRRLPIRLRIASAAAAATAVVLAIVALGIYHRMGTELDASTNRSLRTRAGDIAALVQQADTGLRDATKSDRSLLDARSSGAQILAADGRIVDATSPYTQTPLIDGRRFRSAQKSTVVASLTPPGANLPMRVLATPVLAQGEHLVIVVSASLEPRRQALAKLLSQLLLFAPLGLLLSGAAGWGIAASALRPLSSIRRAAERIDRARLDDRIPSPVHRDELGLLVETLNAMLDRLAEAAHREQRFIADAAHELRSPLATLRAELELCSRRPRSRRELELTLGAAFEEADRLCRLADDLLLLARADQGALALRYEFVDLGDVIDGVARRFTAVAAHHDRSLVVTPRTAPIFVPGDRLRLEQALGNILDNALRHGAGVVSLSAGEAEDGAVVRIADEGSGFPAAIAETAFRPFQRGVGADSGAGSGLGLAIVAEIVRAHRGEISTATRSGSFRVEIRLPVRASIEEAAGGRELDHIEAPERCPP